MFDFVRDEIMLEPTEFEKCIKTFTTIYVPKLLKNKTN